VPAGGHDSALVELVSKIMLLLYDCSWGQRSVKFGGVHSWPFSEYVVHFFIDLM
jgi:hypothetical protein